jgi:sugar lactone lactonase YvrE
MTSRVSLGAWMVAALALLVGCGDATSAAGTGGSGGAGGGADGGASSAGGAGTGGTTDGGGGGGGVGGAPPKAFLSQYPLDAQFPEGGIYDPVGHAFFMGSLADGSIHRVDAATGEDETVFVETATGAWWTLGMAVDDSAGRLWVCAMEDLSNTNADPAYDGYVWEIDIDSGERLAVYPLSAADPEATCTDVAVAEDGWVYVTDRDFGNVYRLASGQAPTTFAQDSALEASLVGQNAAVVTPDQSALLVAIYLPSRLVRVDLVTASVTEVDIDGSFGDLTFLSGADGMTFHQGDVYVAFASELVKLTATLADWSSAVATEVTVPNGMTDVVSTPNGLYLQNGQAIRYALDQEPDPFALVLFSGEFSSP